MNNYEKIKDEIDLIMMFILHDDGGTSPLKADLPFEIFADWMANSSPVEIPKASFAKACSKIL